MTPSVPYISPTYSFLFYAHYFGFKLLLMIVTLTRVNCKKMLILNTLNSSNKKKNINYSFNTFTVGQNHLPVTR